MRMTWSACVLDADSGAVLHDDDGHLVLPCASVGKLLVLLETARRLDDGSLDPGLQLERRDEDLVADSGVWQHLDVDALTVRDLCTLVGTMSDNLATNVLVRHLGLDAVTATAQRLGLGEVHLHDRVRDHRGPGDPPCLATASSRALAQLFARLHRGELLSPAASDSVLGWLSGGADLSMVAAAFDLDPLAHRPEDGPLGRLAHKTGTDLGVRADAGLVVGQLKSEGQGSTVAYAAIARWEPTDHAGTGVALARMRALGERVLSLVAEEP
ncbi:MAG: serine hydrolase [Actinomycetales bacterium]|nr:serine hydrolase [Actinomycetales bacterium]